MRHLLLLTLLGFGGCQCLQPVSEDVDSGVTADAGADAGTPECVRASDCPPLAAPRECGFGAGPATRSCLDRRCVFDCEGTRTCSTAGTCLSCDGGAQCNSASCVLIDDGAAGRIYRSCVAGSDTMDTFRARRGATCTFQLILGDGGAFGDVDVRGDFDTALAHVTEEPGITCTVRALSTALNRLELGCARCLYMLEWP